jgi:hypothetical protein
VQRVVNVLKLPFEKGLSLDLLKSPQHKDKMSKLVHLMNLFYRLLKQMAKDNLRNSKDLYEHVKVFRSHLGKGVLVTPTLKEIFAGKRDLIKLIDVGLVNHFVELLQQEKAPQYIDFLMSVCTCPDPQPAVQVSLSICTRVNVHLPQCACACIAAHAPGDWCVS